MLVNLSGIRSDYTLDAPASAMARGVAVSRSGSTIAKTGDGARPYGFLATEVTTDGLNWLELETIPHAEVEETKVSTGKVRVVLFEPGRIATDQILGTDTFSVGDKVAIAANGLITNTTATGDVYIGTVYAVNQNYGGTTGMLVIDLSHDLGTAA